MNVTASVLLVDDGDILLADSGGIPSLRRMQPMSRPPWHARSGNTSSACSSTRAGTSVGPPASWDYIAIPCSESCLSTRLGVEMTVQRHLVWDRRS